MKSFITRLTTLFYKFSLFTGGLGHKEKEEITTKLHTAPLDLMIVVNDKTVLRITHDRKVILETDIYEAAEGFWEAVKATLRVNGWELEINNNE